LAFTGLFDWHGFFATSFALFGILYCPSLLKYPIQNQGKQNFSALKRPIKNADKQKFSALR